MEKYEEQHQIADQEAPSSCLMKGINVRENNPSLSESTLLELWEKKKIKDLQQAREHPIKGKKKIYIYVFNTY